MDAIYKRRSYHDGFSTEQKISNEDLDAILKAGMNAPSAMDTQPWEFVVVDDPEKLNELSQLTGGTHSTTTASHAIIICAQPTDLAEMNVGLSTQNIVLSATDLGIASLIMGVYPNDEAQSKLHELLNIPDDYTAYIMIGLGYAEAIPPNDRWIESKIHRNKF